jgi:hypothetical protein
MEIKQVNLNDLKPVDKFLLSYPLKPKLYLELWETFAPLPLLIINQAEEIVFGVDFFRLLESQRIMETSVLQVELPDKDALLLNYHLKNKFTGLNLYEKLVFIKKAMPLLSLSDIYRKTGLDIAVNRELEDKLDLLLSTRFREALVNDQIGLKTGLRLCRFPAEDGDVLLDLFGRVSFSSSHQLKILEMAEEILFRDKCPLAEIFDRLGLEQVLESERPQKRIIAELFRHRYPAYREDEEKWQTEINRLDLPEHIKVTHAPFFEQKQLELTIRVQDLDELIKLIEKIKK